MGLRIAVGFAGVAAALVMATPAVAGFTYRVDSVPVGPNSQSPPASATCGKKHVLGGGAFISTGFGVVQYSAADDSGLDDDNKPDDAWQVAMSNLTGIDATVTAFAICEDEMPKYKTLESDVVGELSTGLTCPQGSKVTGAGVVTVGTLTQTYVRTWAPFAFGDSGSGGMSAAVKGSGVSSPLFLQAICTKDLKLEYVKKKLEIPAASGNQIFVKCPAGTQVIGGGGTQNTVGSGWELATTISIPSDGGDADDKPDDSWRIGVSNPSGSEKKIPVVAVCAKS